MLTIHLTKRLDSTIALRLACSDSEIFRHCISVLKFEIPPQCRRFDQSTKHWIILCEAAIELERYIQIVVAKYCADVVLTEEEVGEQERGEAQAASGEDSAFERLRRMSVLQAYGALFLTPDAPPEVTQAAYRALAKLHHPDKGADGRVMRLINHAYGIIEEDLKRKATAA